MKPILELLIEDIQYDIIEIENTSESDYIKVYEIYTKIYNRVDALKRDAFNSDFRYERFEVYKKMYRNNDLAIENGLKHGLYTEHNYFLVKKSLEELSICLAISQ